MQSVILMRHSYAASNNPAWSDHERPLTERGRDLVIRTGQLLAETSIDLIVHSSAARTTETAELIQQHGSSSARLISDDSLYLAPAARYEEVAREHGSRFSTILLVGHNPGIANLINSWSDEYLPIHPGCVAIFRANQEDKETLPNGFSDSTLESFISEGVRVT